MSRLRPLSDIRCPMCTHSIAAHRRWLLNEKSVTQHLYYPHDGDYLRGVESDPTGCDAINCGWCEYLLDPYSPEVLGWRDVF